MPLTRIWPNRVMQPHSSRELRRSASAQSSSIQRLRRLDQGGARPPLDPPTAFVVSALAPSRQRVARLVDELGGEDGHHLVVLDLDDDLRQRDLTVLLELHPAVKTGKIHLRQSIAH